MRARQEAGFSLLELMVVIVIVGILAAIAIPVFLAQRARGWDASAKSDLRNLAGFEEIYYTNDGLYGPIAQIQAAEPRLFASKDVTITVVSYDGAKGYCLSAKHAGSPRTWYYDSQAGGLLPQGATGCPVTTGVAGDSLTG